MIKIVTDSTCDLPAELYTRHNITVVPINIQFGTETFQEGVNIDRCTFYQRIDETGKIPTTSQPSVGQFREVYQALIDGGATEIISMHVTAKLSGTCRSAEMAAQEVSGAKIHVFDSACGSAGLGFMALEAARMAEAGETLSAIIKRLEEIRSRMNIFLTLQDLRYARMSGRVGRLQSALASVLNVKPVIALQDGIIDVTERTRSRRKALDRLLVLTEQVVGRQDPVNVAVMHAEAEEEARALLERAKERFNCQETFIEDLAISLAVHFGPGTVGLVSYQV
jgi:DegV family protein with EDD domain